MVRRRHGRRPADRPADVRPRRRVRARARSSRCSAAIAAAASRSRVGCTLASPVAGLFLALAGVRALAGEPPARSALWRRRRRRSRPARRARRVLLPRGRQPAVLGRHAGVDRRCAARCCCGCCPRASARCAPARCCTSAAALLAFAIATPMGGNASRLGVAFAGPLLLCAALAAGDAAPPARLVLAAAIPLLGWQWWAPVRETIKGAVDPSGAGARTSRRCCAFLDARAEAAGPRRGPVHAPALGVGPRRARTSRSRAAGRRSSTSSTTRSFAPRAAARLTPRALPRWLRREGVHYVALPDVALDPTGRAEARAHPPRPAVPAPRLSATATGRSTRCSARPASTDGVGRLTRLGPQSFTLRARTARLHARARALHARTGASRAAHGCVIARAGGWTLVCARRSRADRRSRTRVRPAPARRRRTRAAAARRERLRARRDAPVGCASSSCPPASARSRRGSCRNGPLDVVRQVRLFVAAFQLYRLTRGLVNHPEAATTAFSNARDLIGIEQRAEHLHRAVAAGVHRPASSGCSTPRRGCTSTRRRRSRSAR